MEPRRILVGVDFRPPSLQAARWAAQLAGPATRVELVTVLPVAGWEFPDHSAFTSLLPASDGALAAMRRRALDGLAGFASMLRGPRVGLHVRVGDPLAELSALAGSLKADLVVLGRHEAGGSGGRTRERLIRHVRVPVLVVGARGSTSPRHVLAALDDASIAERVLRAAGAIACRAGGELTLAHVLARPLPSPIGAGQEEIAGAAPERGVGAAEAVAARHAWLRAQAANLRPEQDDLPVHTIVPHGVPGAQLLAYSQRHPIDLIVLGRNGRHAAGPTELGTTARLLARVAPVPVLVVPPPVPSPFGDRPRERAAYGCVGLGRAVPEAAPPPNGASSRDPLPAA